MTAEQIHHELKRLSKLGKRIFISSSFQSHSIPLLHIISTSGVPVDVVFINTGFHFPETLQYKNQIATQLGIQVKDLRSDVAKHQQRDADGNFHFISDQDYCCHLNKVEPLDHLLPHYDVWISGVRRAQSAERQKMETFEEAPHQTVRFHPILDWTSKDIYDYRKAHKLPAHPLEEQGYFSIGCAPCTQKLDLNDERSGRWFGTNKTECGLHKDLISKWEYSLLAVQDTLAPSLRTC